MANAEMRIGRAMSSKQDRATFGTYSTNREKGLANIVREIVKGIKEGEKCTQKETFKTGGSNYSGGK